jgi:DNA-binding response OmpR family regulator
VLLRKLAVRLLFFFVMPRLHQPSVCRLLVIDADIAVRELCSTILQRQGYEVLAVPDVDSAIRLCARLRWPEIRLVLLDAFLPGLDCVRLLKILRLGSTNIQFVFISSVPAGELAGEFGVPVESPVLQKPFTIPELMEAVRASLHTSPAGTEIAP